MGCEELTEIALPDSLEEFEKSLDSNGDEYESSRTFMDCKNLKKIKIPEKLEAIYEDTFKNTDIEEIEIVGEFKYGNFNVLHSSDELNIYQPALYRNDPKLDNDKDIIELNDSIKTILLINIFGKDDFKVNEADIVLPEFSATPGFYGNTDDKYAYRITEDSKIERLYYNDYEKEYKITTFYKTEAEEIFDFKYNESYGAYCFNEYYGERISFIVIEDLLYIKGHIKPLVLNEKYKEY